MYITLECDYAVRIISCLAIEEKRLDAKTISDKTNVTLRFSLKILRKLVSGGLVKSYKGTFGGYELDKPLNEISLLDVVETIEGTYQLSRCLDNDYPCSRGASGCCAYQNAFRELTDIVRSALSEKTFDELVSAEKCNCKSNEI